MHKKESITIGMVIIRRFMVKKKLPIKRVEYCGKIIKYRKMIEFHKKKKKIDKQQLNTRIKVWKNIIKQGDFCEKCNTDFRIPKENGKIKLKHPHHIITEYAVRHKYPELIDDLKNGILLCSGCHDMFSDSAHQGALEFILWLEKSKPEQYLYLKNYLIQHGNTQ